MPCPASRSRRTRDARARHAPEHRRLPHPHRRLALLTVLVAALAAAGVSAGPAATRDDDVTWTVRTAPNSYGADRSSFSHAVNPGGEVEDAMVVANRGKVPLRLAVYAADGFTTNTGRLDLLPGGEKSVAVGAWTRAGRDTVTIGPGKTVTVPFTLSVPGNATPGDYVGGVVTSLRQSDEAEGINVDRRLGIRVKLRVSGALAPATRRRGPPRRLQRPVQPPSPRGTPPSATRSTTPATPRCRPARRPRSWARSACSGPRRRPSPRHRSCCPANDGR
ncbi:WxL protein peptidoglycan domain-containing protein [Streptomyces corynorhini]|uniref:WxL protein peptidoglycan domain-containing protein n=1 Tax=Streptomyces corynorhini TaxID=2282652 RepID=UPI001F1C47CD|nr:DUF916 domain-containing protein [Streptomyces corynorhini]